MTREEYWEADILEWLQFHRVLSWKNTSTGFFNTKKGYFQRNKSNFVRNGVSDILGCLEWRLLAIEVKTKKDISFFDRPLEELKQRFSEAQRNNSKPSTLKKYQHAIEQKAFIDDVNRDGGIGFYATCIKDVEEALKKRNFNVY